jgi:hypothetical protein
MTFTASLTGVTAEPHDPTSMTPVAIKFRVSYRQDKDAEDSLGA